MLVETNCQRASFFESQRRLSRSHWQCLEVRSGLLGLSCLILSRIDQERVPLRRLLSCAVETNITTRRVFLHGGFQPHFSQELDEQMNAAWCLMNSHSFPYFLQVLSLLAKAAKAFARFTFSHLFWRHPFVLCLSQLNLKLSCMMKRHRKYFLLGLLLGCLARFHFYLGIAEHLL